jgi:hypothetical protein
MTSPNSYSILFLTFYSEILRIFSLFPNVDIIENKFLFSARCFARIFHLNERDVIVNSFSPVENIVEAEKKLKTV